MPADVEPVNERHLFWQKPLLKKGGNLEFMLDELRLL